MSKYKVALQCGHGKSANGTWDCGTSYGGYNEAALMLPITKAAVKYLRSYGVEVISDSDTGNNKNMIVDVAWANKEKCDIYVSIHCDWYKAGSGTLPLYVSSKGKKLATAMNKAVTSGMGMKTRGVCYRSDLWELNGTDMPACIFETGSIKADIKILKGKADAYGKCIAQGICDYLGVKAQAPVKVEKPKKELYRVRKSWNDVASQKGAFNDLEHAKQSADVNGMNVYASNGKLVYTGAKKPTPKKKENRVLIANKANELAYPTAPNISKYPSGKPTLAYKSALASLPYSQHKWCAAAKAGANCDVFVWVCVVKSGVDKNFPSGLWRQLRYMNAHPEKYVKIKTSEAKAGDIFFYRKDVKGQHGHIGICYSDGKVKEASHNSYYPRTNKSLKDRLSTKGKKYVYVFRVK